MVKINMANEACGGIKIYCVICDRYEQELQQSWSTSNYLMRMTQIRLYLVPRWGS